MNTREEYEILDAAIDNLSVKEIYVEMNNKYLLSENQTEEILYKLYQDNLVDFYIFDQKRVQVELDNSGFPTGLRVSFIFLCQTSLTFDRYSYLRKILG